MDRGQSSVGTLSKIGHFLAPEIDKNVNSSLLRLSNLLKIAKSELLILNIYLYLDVINL